MIIHPCQYMITYMSTPNPHIRPTDEMHWAGPACTFFINSRLSFTSASYSFQSRPSRTIRPRRLATVNCANSHTVATLLNSFGCITLYAAHNSGLQTRTQSRRSASLTSRCSTTSPLIGSRINSNTCTSKFKSLRIT